MQSNFNVNEEVGLYDQFRMGVYNSRIKSSIYTHYIWTQDLNTLKKLSVPKEVQDIRVESLKNRKNEKQTKFQYLDILREEEASIFSSIQPRTTSNKPNLLSNNLAVPKRSSKEGDSTSRSHDNLPPFHASDDKSRVFRRNHKKPNTESQEELKSRVIKKRVTSFTGRLSNHFGVIEELTRKNSPPQVIKLAIKDLTQEAKNKKLLDVDKHELVYTSLFKAPEVLSPLVAQKKEKFLSSVQSLQEFINPKFPTIPRIAESPDSKFRNKSLKKKPENARERFLAKIVSDFGTQIKARKRTSVPFTLMKSISTL